jgi:hypothetical protein
MALEQRTRDAIDAFVERVRHDLDAHVRTLTSELLRLITDNQRQWRSEVEGASADARADAERSFQVRLQTLRGDMVREVETRVATERSLTPAPVTTAAVREGRIDTVSRLLASVRRIDEAGSLTAIFEALARGVAAETSRVAILLIDGDTLRCWGHFGFAPGQSPIDTTIGDAGALAATIALKQASFVQPTVDNRDQSGPAFMRVPAGHTGLVVPLTVGDEVVAVLYADDVGRREEHEDAPVWTEEVQLLARQASVRLEVVTSARTVEAFNKV